MNATLIAFLAAFLVTFVMLFAVSFVALILSVRRAQQKIDAQMEVIGMYRAERRETINDYREVKA